MLMVTGMTQSQDFLKRLRENNGHADDDHLSKDVEGDDSADLDQQR